jgi:O-antigen/teichoic acid export membrane protein
VGFDAFYVAMDRLRVTMRILTVGFLVTIPTLYFLALRIPDTGAAWGVVFGQWWVLPNFVYILLFFRSGRHERALAPRPARV